MNKALLIGVALLCLGVTRCSDGVSTPDREAPRELTAGEERLVSAGNGFGIELFKEIVAEEGERNLFVAPLSVSMALGMVYNGAAGGTESAMRDVLGFGDLTNVERQRARCETSWVSGTSLTRR